MNSIKNIVFFLTFFLTPYLSVFSADLKIKKKYADSLFVHKKYLESFQIYDELIKNNKISQDLLLKMAYVKEGEGDFTMALYYLNLFQLNYPNSYVLKKMDALAIKNHLTGYEFTDYEYFVSLYNKFNYQIFFFIVGISVIVFLYSVYKVFFSVNYVKFRLYMSFLLILVSYAFINLGIPSYKGIVATENTLVVDSPSAAGKVVGRAKKGNRVNILKKDELWYEIIWNNKVAFVKNDKLLVIVNNKNAEQFNVFSLMYNSLKIGYKKGLETVQDLRNFLVE